jgi:hypothetical protein
LKQVCKIYEIKQKTEKKNEKELGKEKEAAEDRFGPAPNPARSPASEKPERVSLSPLPPINRWTPPVGIAYHLWT